MHQRFIENQQTELYKELEENHGGKMYQEVLVNH